MSTLVTLRNITKTYQRGPEQVQVLHGIDLDIASGDFVALMGPSGSGKTTLLNLIGGLDSPTGGEISIEGERIDQMSGGQLSTWRSHHVGFVFQFYNLMPMLTAQKNVELPLLLTHLSAAQRRCRAIYTRFSRVWASTSKRCTACLRWAVPPPYPSGACRMRAWGDRFRLWTSASTTPRTKS